MQPNPPAPVSAVFVNSQTAAIITFDQDLQAIGAWSGTTFVIHQPSRSYKTGGVNLLAANQVRVIAGDPTTVLGSPTIDYDDAQATLIGINGLQVVSFVSFPCPPT